MNSTVMIDKNKIKFSNLESGWLGTPSFFQLMMCVFVCDPEWGWFEREGEEEKIAVL